MKTHLITQLSIVALIGIGILSSCQKHQTAQTESAEDVLKMDMEEMDYTPEELYADNDCNINFSTLVSSCATVTSSSSTFPKTITVDYGTGCVDAKGRTKKGKIIINLSNSIKQVGAIRVVTFEDFYVNDVKIEGTRTAENIGLNGADNYVIKVTGDIKATKENLSRSRTFERFREWTSGFNTCDPQDDEFLITGSGVLTNRNGREIPHSIIDPILVRPNQCNYPLAGTVDVGNENRGVVIDFGNGMCDNLAEIRFKKRNRTFTVNLDTRKIVQ